jgi:quinol monooxygenase YgiN
MYASVTVIEVRGAIDPLLDVIRDALLPVAKAQEGFVGLEVLSNPGLGRVFLISRWQTERALQAAEMQREYQQGFAQINSLLTIPPVEENYAVSLLV